MGKLKSLLLPFCAFVCALFLLCTLRTYFFLEDKGSEELFVENSKTIDVGDESWKRFAQSIRYPTVSWSAGVYDKKAMDNYVKFLLKAYRPMFAVPWVNYEIINKRSLLITVDGTDTSSLPYMLMGHYDVVPAEVSKWSVDPFSAEIRDGRMYGRGTIDCKLIVHGILEALFEVVKSGKQPRKNILIAFGHDEEVGGNAGAVVIAETLRKRGIKKVEYILDEGMPIVRNLIPGVDRDIALIGVTEKGYISLNISTFTTPGHSSMPSGISSIGIISKAISNLEANPLPSRLDDVTRGAFEEFGRKMRFPLNVIFTNFWLFRPLILTVLKWKPDTASMVRTTTAVTMMGGGTKTNVLPSHAWAAVNFRIHPSSNTKEVIETVKYIIGDDRVKVDVLSGFEAINPAPISPHSGSKDIPYRLIHRSLLQIHKNSLPAPGTMIANTDTRHYQEFTEYVFRHFPIVLTRKDIQGIHGHDENISKENFDNAVKFYYQIMKNSDEEDFDKTPEDWSIKKEL